MAKGKATLVASSVDPTLDALFSASSGPVKAPSASRYSELLLSKERKEIEPAAVDATSDEEEQDDEVLSELEEGEGLGDDDEEDEEDKEESESEEESSAEEEAVKERTKKEERRKRKRDEYDDLESKYLRKLADDDDDETPTEKRPKHETEEVAAGEMEIAAEAEESEDKTTLVHESLQKPEEHVDIEMDKANRTLFLGNVSSEAISSSKAKKQLMSHLASPLSILDAATGPHKVESLRFRSTAFAGGGMPKRAAYATKSLLTATTKSTNAYVVYTTPLAARTALKALSGTVVLERHMRADSVAHPTPIDHRRCVFVGNLGFVDDETVLNTTAEGETTTKKRNKVPSDIEEGLWRTFNQHAGKVESVRVPRDPKTRVGKGFAYVQFYDGNDVESAMLLNEKKFPPMLPRALRVSRAKDPSKTALAVERKTKARLEAMGGGAGKPKNTKYKHKATPEQQSLAGRAGRLLGRAGAVREQKRLKGEKPRNRGREDNGAANGVAKEMKTPEQIVFEGRRASAKDGKPKDIKFGKQRGNKRAALAKTKNRGARRAAEWRKKGSD